MSETFLEQFERKRRERLEADRSFPLAGETLVHKPAVAPEVGQRLEQARVAVAAQLDQAMALQRELQKRVEDANGDGPNLEGLDLSVLSDMKRDDEIIAAADEAILACLEPGSHKAWGRLRDPAAAYPLDFNDIMGIADYLLGRVTGIPTDAPAGSSAGRTKTAKPSKAASSSPARSRRG